MLGNQLLFLVVFRLVQVGLDLFLLCLQIGDLLFKSAICCSYSSLVAPWAWMVPPAAIQPKQGRSLRTERAKAFCGKRRVGKKGVSDAYQK